jgi:uncharacterized coiled-coil DUF342 family protein
MYNLHALKKSITAIILTLVAFSSFAQSAETEVEILQEAFGLDKKVAVANFMELGDDAESFWNLYDEYEAERKNLGKSRIKVIEEYAQEYPNISDEKILELFERSTDIKKSFDKLQNTYFNRMRKEIGVSKAAQFWQLESYFNSMIQANIYSRIPFIGEKMTKE